MPVRRRPGPRSILVLMVVALLTPLLVLARPEPALVAPAAPIGTATGDYAILNQYDRYFLEASAKYTFPANLIKAVAMVEGGWAGTSPAGAVGIMQIMPGIWGTVASLNGYNIYEPRGNIMMGTYILAYNYKTYGSYQAAVSRYLGTGVDPWTGISTDYYWQMANAHWKTLDQAAATNSIAVTGDPNGEPLAGGNPFRARDGDLKTSWAVLPKATPPSSGRLEFDLGYTRKLASISWVFLRTGYADKFVVRTSLDGVTWQTVAWASNAPVNQWQWFRAERSARYVRFQFYNPNGDLALGYIAEVRFVRALDERPTATPTRTPRPSPTVPPGIAGGDLPIAASSGTSDTTGSKLAWDRSTSTDWRTLGAPAQAWVRFDLGRRASLTGISWYLSAVEGTASYTIEVSDDKVRWSTLGSYGPSPARRWHTRQVNAAGRYVRFVFTDPGGSPYLGGLAEVRIYGAFGAAAAPTATPTPRGSATATPTRTATPVATVQPAQETPIPAEPPTEIPTDTATVEIPSATATPEPLPTETETPTPEPTPTDVPTEVPPPPAIPTEVPVELPADAAAETPLASDA